MWACVWTFLLLLCMSIQIMRAHYMERVTHFKCKMLSWQLRRTWMCWWRQAEALISNFLLRFSEKNLSRLVFLKELEKIYGKPQSIEPERLDLRRKLFSKKETEMIFQHFKQFLENGTIPKKKRYCAFPSWK